MRQGFSAVHPVSTRTHRCTSAARACSMCLSMCMSTLFPHTAGQLAACIMVSPHSPGVEFQALTRPWDLQLLVGRVRRLMELVLLPVREGKGGGGEEGV